MKAPNSWEQITIEKYIDFLEVKDQHFESVLDFQLERIAVILDKDAEELETKIDLLELQELTIKTKWIDGKVKPKEEEIEGLTYKGLEDLRIGEFIDLEILFSKGYYLNAHKILAILYRKTRLNEWGGIEIEPYRFVNTKERAEFFLNTSIAHAQHVINEYLEFREDFIEKRKELFEGEEEEEEGEIFDNLENENEEERERSTIDQKEAEAMERALKHWSWEAFIYKLCKGDLRNFEEVTDLSLKLVMKFEKMKIDLKIED